MALETTSLTGRAPRRSSRVLIVASAFAVCATVLLLAAVWNGNSPVFPQEKLAVVEIPDDFINVYGQTQLTQQNVLRLQRLWPYGNTDETDMWIRVAEAIDADAVNDPALPPVPDEITAEAQQAQNEAKLEHEYLEKYYGGTVDDATSWRVLPMAGNGEILLVEA